MKTKVCFVSLFYLSILSIQAASSQDPNDQEGPISSAIRHKKELLGSVDLVRLFFNEQRIKIDDFHSKVSDQDYIPTDADIIQFRTLVLHDWPEIRRINELNENIRSFPKVFLGWTTCLGTLACLADAGGSLIWAKRYLELFPAIDPTEISNSEECLLIAEDLLTKRSPIYAITKALAALSRTARVDRQLLEGQRIQAFRTFLENLKSSQAQQSEPTDS